MPSSIYDIENFLTSVNESDPRWDIYSNGYKNIRFAVPEALSVTVTSADEANLPGLAQKYLGSRFLWWAILAFNGLYDGIEDVVPGTVLRIPEAASLIAFLKSSPRQEGLSRVLL